MRSCVLICLLAACGSSKDGDAPATPTIDAVATPTLQSTQVVRGDAEPDAFVQVLGATLETTGPIVADAAGRWAAVVDLSPGWNTLVVTATDRAGNTSDPVETTILRLAGDDTAR